MRSASGNRLSITITAAPASSNRWTRSASRLRGQGHWPKACWLRSSRSIMVTADAPGPGRFNTCIASSTWVRRTASGPGLTRKTATKAAKICQGPQNLNNLWVRFGGRPLTGAWPSDRGPCLAGPRHRRVRFPHARHGRAPSGIERHGTGGLGPVAATNQYS